MKRLLVILSLFGGLAFIVGHFLFSDRAPAAPSNPVVTIDTVISWQASTTSELLRTYFIRGKPGEMPQLVAAVLAPIDGVQSIYPRPYEVAVGIPACYSWDEVHPAVIKALAELATTAAEAAEEQPVQDKRGGT